MKQPLFPNITRPLGSLQLSLLLCSSLHAAVTFTVAPAAVSNSYNGSITLQITGLASGDTVVVEKFLDLNTNGIVDPGDWLVQQFNLTDGQPGMVIGGVTNFNVPGDSAATAGQITAKLNFSNGDFVQNIAGQYLFRLSSPSGHFLPITSRFTVTNLSYAQKFTGNVVSSGTTTALPNGIVLLFPPPRSGKNGPGGSPVAGAVVNNSGSYTIPVPPGTYSLVAFKNAYVVDFSAAPVLTLGGGQTITTNLPLLAATSTISGKLVDANNPNLGLPGILLSVQANNGLFGVGTTDTNGNFTASVQAGSAQWALRADDTSLIVHGYLGSQNKTGASPGQTGVTLAVPKATALIYGKIQDSLGNPLPGNDVYVNDNNSYLYETDAYSDSNGNYVAGVLGGLGANDPWWASVSTDAGSTGYVFSQPPFDQYGGTNISAGASVQANFTALAATNYITGNVQASGTNLAMLGVYANASINGVDFNVYADTDPSGNYSFNVGNGTWYVGLNCGGGSDSLDTLLGNGNYLCPSSQSVTINNLNGSASFTVQLCNGVQILTTSLPNAQVGSYYNINLQGSGCSGALNWSLNDPQGFPPGLSFPGNGSIQGTPSTSGTFNFSVQLNDGNGHSSSQNLSLYIAPASSPLQVATTSLPNATNGILYSQTLQATGGQTPYAWSLALGSAPLPPGLVLNPSGSVSGVPTSNGTFPFIVHLRDANSGTSDQTLSITVNPATQAALGSLLWLANQFQIQVTGVAGQNYTLQMSSDLSSTNWTSLLVTNNPTTGSFIVFDPAPTDRQRFYRLKAGP